MASIYSLLEQPVAEGLCESDHLLQGSGYGHPAACGECMLS